MPCQSDWEVPPLQDQTATLPAHQPAAALGPGQEKAGCLLLILRLLSVIAAACRLPAASHPQSQQAHRTAYPIGQLGCWCQRVGPRTQARPRGWQVCQPEQLLLQLRHWLFLHWAMLGHPQQALKLHQQAAAAEGWQGEHCWVAAAQPQARLGHQACPSAAQAARRAAKHKVLEKGDGLGADSVKGIPCRSFF